MKILMAVHQFLPRHQAGTELYTYYLAKELSKRHQVHLFYAEREGMKGEHSVQRGTYNGLSFTEVINNNMDFEKTYKNPKIEEIFGNLIREFQPDVVHFQHLLNLSTGMILIAKEKGIPTALTLHEYWLMCP